MAGVWYLFFFFSNRESPCSICIPCVNVQVFKINNYTQINKYEKGNENTTWNFPNLTNTETSLHKQTQM